MTAGVESWRVISRPGIARRDFPRTFRDISPAGNTISRNGRSGLRNSAQYREVGIWLPVIQALADPADEVELPSDHAVPGVPAGRVPAEFQERGSALGEVFSHGG